MNTLENAEGLVVSNYLEVVMKTLEAPAPVVLGESCEQKRFCNSKSSAWSRKYINEMDTEILFKYFCIYTFMYSSFLHCV